ncbi:monocarboxylate transporter 14-like isoform X2 [Topomyia yanbarensis]|uniref:monocarboxylate transporter 14-like isoform X2 n=1 Tax=Topomyia yanbarensis TaxID=2498891 RepID=UPI00273A867F|nr:monocarboxylate transporter 14-like isoform X2 [Topomyia yanbarensis]XP_058837104.1 monocarboxylate transporter 14-like isoform X2 [Topomyia yanbarensis]
MVVEIQITDPSNKSFMVRNNTDNQLNNNNYNSDNNNYNANARFGKEELEALKTTLLNSNEVTFCNLSDDEKDEDHPMMSQLTVVDAKRKKRLNSDNSEADSILSSCQEPVKKNKPKIPDGGYGWVVVFASVMISLIMDGVSFSFGLMYTEWLDYFGESKSKTAWVGSLFIAVPLLVGPIMSNLVDRYGCQKMTMLGGFVATCGFALASICTSVEQLYFTFGILAGLGLGVGYVTAVVSIAFWFDKRRTFATGIGASGTGIGTFLYAPFTQWLIEIFGWRGTTLILAGTLFNLCVMGALLRDPDWMIEESKLESRSQSMQTFSNSSVCLDELKKMIETGVPREHLLDTLVTNVNTEANQVIAPENPALSKKYQSELTLPTFLKLDQEQVQPHPRSGSRRSLRQTILVKETFPKLEEHPSPPSEETKPTHATLASSETLNSQEKISSYAENVDPDHKTSLETLSVASLEEAYLSAHRQKELRDSRAALSSWSLDEKSVAAKEDLDDRRSFRKTSLDVVYENEIFNPNVNTAVTLLVPKQKKLEPKHNLKRSNTHPTHQARYSNFLKDIRVHKNSIHYRGALLHTHRYRLKASSCPNIYRNSMTTIAREKEERWYDGFIDAMKTMFDFSLFLEFRFGMLSLSILLLFIWYIIPYFYIPDYMLLHGYTEQEGANMISIVGVASTIGMVGLGWLGDQPWVDVTKYYAVCLAFCGLSVAAVPIAVTNYYLMAIVSIVFGFTFASTYSFTPIIIVRLVSLDDFTIAYGLCLLIQGIGSLVGPPLAGMMYDLTERWDPSFYTGGFFLVLSGVCAWAVGYLPSDVAEDKESEALSSTVTE